MGDDSGNVDQIAGADADNLVGDADVVAAGVAGLVGHARIYEHPSGIVKLRTRTAASCRRLCLSQSKAKPGRIGVGVRRGYRDKSW